MKTDEKGWMRRRWMKVYSGRSENQRILSDTEQAERCEESKHTLTEWRFAPSRSQQGSGSCCLCSVVSTPRLLDQLSIFFILICLLPPPFYLLTVLSSVIGILHCLVSALQSCSVDTSRSGRVGRLRLKTQHGKQISSGV